MSLANVEIRGTAKRQSAVRGVGFVLCNRRERGTPRGTRRGTPERRGSSISAVAASSFHPSHRAGARRPPSRFCGEGFLCGSQFFSSLLSRRLRFGARPTPLHMLSRGRLLLFGNFAWTHAWRWKDSLAETSGLRVTKDGGGRSRRLHAGSAQKRTHVATMLQWRRGKTRGRAERRPVFSAVEMKG